MIQTEYLNDGIFIKHYSDINMMLLQNETGIMYSDPVDLVPCKYTYTETNISIEEEVIDENEAMIEDYQDALSELGVKV